MQIAHKEDKGGRSMTVGVQNVRGFKSTLLVRAEGRRSCIPFCQFIRRNENEENNVNTWEGTKESVAKALWH